MQVKIINGSHRGVHGALAQLHGTARVPVNLELLNRGVAVDVNLNAIAAVNDIPAAIPA